MTVSLLVHFKTRTFVFKFILVIAMT